MSVSLRPDWCPSTYCVRKEVEGKDTSGVRRNQMDEIDQAAISIADLDLSVPNKAREDMHGERAGREWPKEIARVGLASELRVVSWRI